MSNYPPGVSGNEPEIAGYPETQESGQCDNCHLKFDDLTFTWFEGEALAECPECLGEIWIDAPEPDYDAIAEMKADRLYERMHDE